MGRCPRPLGTRLEKRHKIAGPYDQENLSVKAWSLVRTIARATVMSSLTNNPAVVSQVPVKYRNAGYMLTFARYPLSNNIPDIDENAMGAFVQQKPLEHL